MFGILGVQPGPPAGRAVTTKIAFAVLGLRLTVAFRAGTLETLRCRDQTGHAYMAGRSDWVDSLSCRHDDNG